jgi:adenine specific DNA methylase Mod
MANTALDELKSFLSKLFQFESEDLDFGIYRILHIKKKEIARFIDDLLTTEVKKQLKLLSESDSKALQQKLTEIEAQDTIIKYKQALENKDVKRIELYEEDFAAAITEYKQIKLTVANIRRTNASESDIYNHLTRFFSRYYDKGDFVSKRKYGKNEKYVVPYNGEETYFHWANNDQYYIKSTEFFRRYAFRFNHSAGALIATFRIAEAEEENGNGKSDENKYFVLAKQKPELTEKEFTIWLDYRTLTDKEKETLGKKQDEINNKATTQLKELFGKEATLAELWKADSGKNLLEKKFSHYTARNKYDFFIHKDLKNFFERELDFYIKNEFLNLDEMGLSDSQTHYEQLHIKIKAMKTFRLIANTIIEFLSSIENFQKQLWEKRKFIISTNYVITLDKLEQLTSISFVEGLITELLKSKEQLKEWENYFGHKLKTKNDFHIPTNGKQLKIENEKFASKFLKLPVDTKYFNSEFRNTILNEISKNNLLDDCLNGCIYEGDNFHSMKLLDEKFFEQLKGIYIDPPYNTKVDTFLYKDSYKHSCWISMMFDRLCLLGELIKDGGVIYENIGEEELQNLISINNTIFNEENKLALIPRVTKTASDQGSWFAPSVDYVLCYAKHKQLTPYFTDDVDISLYKKTEADGERKGERFRDDIAFYQSSLSDLRPNQRYFVECPDGSLVIPPGKALPTKKKDGELVTQLLGDGRWRWSLEDGYLKKKHLLVFKETKTSPLIDSNGNQAKWNVYTKSYLLDRQEKGSKPRNFIVIENELDIFFELIPESEYEKKSIADIEKIAKYFFSKLRANSILLRGDNGDKESLYNIIIKDKKIDVKLFSDLNAFLAFANKLIKLQKNLVITEYFNRKGADLLNRFGILFPYSKPVELVEHLFGIMNTDVDDILGDVFAGSGTTAHAIMCMNNEDEGNRKFVLAEQNEYINNIIIPRLKKVAYSFNWNNAKPEDMKGLGVFFKYQNLEQYEDALENIVFDKEVNTAQAQIQFADYIPKYMMLFETKGSSTFVNTDEMQTPFDYQLKVFDNYQYIPKEVDLVETFNYLIGLHIHKHITSEHQKRQYVFVTGNDRHGKGIAVVWRNTKDLDLNKDKDFITKQLDGIKYSSLFVNGDCMIANYNPIEPVFKNKMLK